MLQFRICGTSHSGLGVRQRERQKGRNAKGRHAGLDMIDYIQVYILHSDKVYILHIEIERDNIETQGYFQSGLFRIQLWVI